jgi:glucokinase
MEIIAADIGGTHISVASIRWSGENAVVDQLIHKEVDTTETSEKIISLWAETIKHVVENRSQYLLGISMPGPFDYQRGISLIKSQGKMRSLFGLSVKELLSEKLEISPRSILFTNDAECFLKGESLVGAGKGYTNLIGLTLGTGLGSAIQIDEVTKDAKLWTAPFRNGIAEDYLGTNWFISRAQEGFGIKIKGVKELVEPSFDTQISQKMFSEFGRALGEFLFPYVSKLQTQKIILGGKIALSADLFLPSTQSYLGHLGLSLPIAVSQLGENAALMGACASFLSKPIVHEI